MFTRGWTARSFVRLVRDLPERGVLGSATGLFPPSLASAPLASEPLRALAARPAIKPNRLAVEDGMPRGDSFSYYPIAKIAAQTKRTPVFIWCSVTKVSRIDRLSVEEKELLQTLRQRFGCFN
jgi:hypothetical protein